MAYGRTKEFDSTKFLKDLKAYCKLNRVSYYDLRHYTQIPKEKMQQYLHGGIIHKIPLGTFLILCGMIKKNPESYFYTYKYF
ncbi:hypothetical protein ACFS6H_16475 [Terrimonas rubra]|uniref:Uncharacterized protein n=1 Tax=Terrimonas rubra TaxID=1035890 RepID=A0ABW6A813_9BACT